MAHMMDEREASGRCRSSRAAFSQTAGQEVWVSDDRDQDPLLDPTQTQNQALHGCVTPLSSELSVSVSTGQAERKRAWQSGSQQSPDDGRPSTSSKRSCMDSGRSRSRRTASTDSSPGVMSWASSLSLSEDNVERWICREPMSLSSRGSYNVIWRWSGDGSDSQNEQGRSDSLEGLLCPPLPGQVPVEPTETALGAVEASPVNKISTEKPTECRKRKGIRSFLNRLWTAMKNPFRCCCHSSAVDVVEPFVPEPEPDPEPSSPAPDHSGVKPDNGNNILAIPGGGLELET